LRGSNRGHLGFTVSPNSTVEVVLIQGRPRRKPPFHLGDQPIDFREAGEAAGEFLAVKEPVADGLAAGVDAAAADALARQARPVFDALMRDVATLRPSDRELLLQRARTNAGFGRWEQAAGEFVVLRQLGDFGAGSFAWAEAAIYLAAGGKTDAHRAHCEQMLDRFKGSTEPVVLNHVAMSCLFVPKLVGKPEQLLDLAETALKANPALPWHVFTAALARMGAGQNESAAALVRDYLKRGEHKRFGSQDEAVLRLVLGMALARTKKSAEARVELTAAVNLFEERFPPGKEPAHLQEPPHGWASVRAVYLMAKPVLDKLPPEAKK